MDIASSGVRHGVNYLVVESDNDCGTGTVGNNE